jgi:hypothetical protein
MTHLDSTRCERHHEGHHAACMSLCPTARSRVQEHVVLLGTASEPTGTHRDLSCLSFFLRCIPAKFVTNGAGHDVRGWRTSPSFTQHGLPWARKK